MREGTRVLTNTAAAGRLRALLHRLTREPPEPGPGRHPAPEERLLLSDPDDTPLETP